MNEKSLVGRNIVIRGGRGVPEGISIASAKGSEWVRLEPGEYEVVRESEVSGQPVVHIRKGDSIYQVHGDDVRFSAKILPKTAKKTAGLVDNGDGTLTDHATGLMWQKDDDGVERTQAEAFAHCSRLSLAGFNDWRLPTLQEFRGLAQAVQLSGLSIVPYLSVSTGSDYWTATPGPHSSVAYIADGTTMFKGNKYCVRAVRKV